MELTTPQISPKVVTPREIMDSATRELEKINATDATICWYDPIDGSEKLIKFSDLSEEEQQSIRTGLEGFEQGNFISLDDYERQLQSDF